MDPAGNPWMIKSMDKNRTIVVCWEIHVKIMICESKVYYDSNLKDKLALKSKTNYAYTCETEVIRRHNTPHKNK